MSSRTHANSLTGAELDYAIARFLETLPVRVRVCVSYE
jgi:hypothetical protein